MSHTARAVSPTTLRHVMLAAAIGSALEWYDFFIYGTASALVFGELFFPKFDATVGTLAAFATFAVGFLARPFGGLFFGHFGDRMGRKPMLVATLLLVGGGTFLIGLLPTYATIGIWAPVLLLLMRLLQGFGAGAEYGGAVIMAVEFAPPGQARPLRQLRTARRHRRQSAGGRRVLPRYHDVEGRPADVGLAHPVPGLVAVAWSRRLYSRADHRDTGVHRGECADVLPLRAPAIEALRRHPRNFFVVVGARLAENGLGYLFPVFGLSYVINTLHMPRELAITGVMLGNVAEIFGIVLFSWLSDKVGRRPVYMGGALFSAAFAFPFFMLAETLNPSVDLPRLHAVMGIGSARDVRPAGGIFR